MDHMYISKSENSSIFQSYQQQNNNKPQTRSSSSMDLVKENKQLKSMLLLHLNVIQEQSDMLVSKNDLLLAKDKQIASLQAKLDRLEAKLAGSGQDENLNVNNTSPLHTVHGYVGGAAVQNVRTSGVQPLSRGTIMRSAALNQNSGKCQVRVRPLMISLKKKVVPSSSPANLQQNAQSQDSQIQSNGFSAAILEKIKSEPNVKNEIKTVSVAVTDINSPPWSRIPSATNGRGGNRIEDGGMISSEDSEPLQLFACDGSPEGLTMELRLEDDDLDEEEEEKELAMDVKMQPMEVPESKEARLELSPIKSELKEARLILSPNKSESSKEPSPGEQHPRRQEIKSTLQSLAPSQSFSSDVLSEQIPQIVPTKRSPSECLNRVPRKYSRVMSTRKLYVTRHWEEEDVDEPNSLVVPELKEGESNLEVPHWKEIDTRGLDEEVLAEDAPQMVVATEDLSEAAFLKRHAKHEADERRRKKWDIQRFREQRTIEKLKKRHCKSDIYYATGLGGKASSMASSSVGMGMDEQQNVTYPVSLFPNLNNIRHVETTEYLPVQAFGEPIPTLADGEFQLPWHGGGGAGAAGSVEWMQSDSGLGALTVGGETSGGNSKYSSFYVKQNSSSLPLRHPSSSSGSHRYRFKRIKSQSGSRR